MPVLSEEFCKAPGKPCDHLVPGGCGIYADRPPACRVWHWVWREDGWLWSRPEYRPDRLGVMFSAAAGDLSIWEAVLWDAEVNYHELGDKHIFAQLVKLNNWLHGTDKRPSDYLNIQ
jgi:hypothetical protein